jgi:hypothetical protein
MAHMSTPDNGENVDLGGLATGGAMQQLGGPLAGVDLIQPS